MNAGFDQRVQMEDALQRLRDDLKTCQSLEAALRGRHATLVRSRSKGGTRPTPKSDAPQLTEADVKKRVADCLEACKHSRKRHCRKAGPPDDLSDRALSQFTRFTDGVALDVYKHFLHYVPRLVNVVTVRSTQRPHRAPTTHARASRCAARGSHPDGWFGDHAAARSQAHRQALRR